MKNKNIEKAVELVERNSLPYEVEQVGLAYAVKLDGILCDENGKPSETPRFYMNSAKATIAKDYFISKN
jgi:hypothetical protein